MACRAAGVVALQGVELNNFYIALVLLGIGWNFGFIGATSMLAGAHEPHERGRMQGLNDLLVFGGVTFASLSSGGLMNCSGGNPVQCSFAAALASSRSCRRPASAAVHDASSSSIRDETLDEIECARGTVPARDAKLAAALAARSKEVVSPRFIVCGAPVVFVRCPCKRANMEWSTIEPGLTSDTIAAVNTGVKWWPGAMGAEIGRWFCSEWARTVADAGAAAPAARVPDDV